MEKNKTLIKIGNLIRYNKIKSILTSLSLYFFASAVSASLGILINPFLAINLDPKDYALIGYYLSFNTLFLPLISFSLVSFYSRKFFLKETIDKERLRNIIVTIQILAGLVSSFLIILIFNLYANLTGLSFKTYPYIQMIVFTIFFSNFQNILLTEFRFSNKAKNFFKFSVLNAIVNSLLGVLLVVAFKYGANGRLLGMLLTAIFMGCLSLYYLRFKFVFDWEVLKEGIGFTWPMLISGVLYYLFMGIDRVFLEKLKDETELGYYNVGFQISAYLSIFSTVILQTFDPNIYEATAQNNILKALKYVALTVFIVAIINLAFILFANPIINVLTFGRYLKSVPYAQIISIRNITMVFAFATSDLIIGLGKSKIELVNRIIGSLIALLTYYILIQKYSFYGAAWGQSITLFFMGLISLIYIITRLPKKKNKTSIN